MIEWFEHFTRVSKMCRKTWKEKAFRKKYTIALEIEFEKYLHSLRVCLRLNCLPYKSKLFDNSFATSANQKATPEMDLIFCRLCHVNHRISPLLKITSQGTVIEKVWKKQKNLDGESNKKHEKNNHFSIFMTSATKRLLLEKKINWTIFSFFSPPLVDSHGIR